jgi:hypothetical protein
MLPLHAATPSLKMDGSSVMQLIGMGQDKDRQGTRTKTGKDKTKTGRTRHDDRSTAQPIWYQCFEIYTLIGFTFCIPAAGRAG